MKRASVTAIAAAAIAAGPAWISAASAQGYGTQQQPPAQQQPPTQQQMPQQQSFSDQDLQSFAAAAQEVQQISEEYLPQMQKAAPQEQQTIRDEATQKMVEAIEQEGLSVQQYNQITSAVRVDPETAAKVEEHMK